MLVLNLSTTIKNDLFFPFFGGVVVVDVFVDFRNILVHFGTLFLGLFDLTWLVLSAISKWWPKNQDINFSGSVISHAVHEPSLAVLWTQRFWWGVQVKFQAAGAGHVWIQKDLNKSAIGVQIHAWEQREVDEM